MKIIIVVGLLLLLLAGCNASKFQSGTYRVQSATRFHGKSIVRFEGLKKEFVFSVDTLKRGDLVYFADIPKGSVVVNR